MVICLGAFCVLDGRLCGGKEAGEEAENGIDFVPAY